MTGTPKSAAHGLPPPPPPAASRGKPPPVPPAAAGAIPPPPPIGTALFPLVPARDTTPKAPAPELAAPGTREANRESSTTDAPTAGRRSTAELLFELDAPSRPTSSRELEVAVVLDSQLEDLGASGPRAQAGELTVETEVEEATDALEMSPIAAATLDWSQFELLRSLPPEGKPQTPQQQQQRLWRVIGRVLTCRDCFRWMGSLGVVEADRKAVARVLLELDAALERPAGLPSVVKEPEAALKEATPEQLEAVERLLAPIEDKLLSLDEQVLPETFLTQLGNRKQSKKIVARYGRLLATRRFSAGQRRDRFELIATHLLTELNAAGLRRILPPDRARPVLEHLVGGLPHKSKDLELGEALTHLKEAFGRLAEIATHDEFFDSGYFLDVHGYKVSMRDQLLSPEFIYLSVLIDAEIHNRLEGWVSDLTRLHNSNQLTSMAEPREQIMRRMREQEEAVDDIFTVKRRAPAQQKRDEPAKTTPPKKPKSKRETEAKPQFVFDRQFVALIASALVTLAALGYVVFMTGTVRLQAVEALDEPQLARISAMLGPGWIKGSGSGRRFEGELLRRRWSALDARRRTEQAEQITKALGGLGVKNARIAVGGRPAIEIRDGLVSFVQGGKL